jgi:putative transposase
VLGAVAVVVRVLSDLIVGVGLTFRHSASLEAEVLFLRRQLALYSERWVKPRPLDAATWVSLTLLSRLFEWRPALVVVRPETLIRWHRAGFRLFWKWQSRSGS